ncbi:MAG: hypothetical protein L0346_09965 [Chloroflexi bacterium]|nr:hypothetical protein [Chloroflexota bacterium]
MIDFGGMGAFGLIIMLLFWVGFIALAVWLVGLLFPVVKKQSDDGDALLAAQEVLKAHHARGELTDEQDQQMLKTIQ